MAAASLFLLVSVAVVWRSWRAGGAEGVSRTLRRAAVALHVGSTVVVAMLAAALLGPWGASVVALAQIVVLLRAWHWPWLTRLVAALVLTSESESGAAVLSCPSCRSRNRVRSSLDGALPGGAVCGRCKVALR
jgi:hypothetical protein